MLLIVTLDKLSNQKSTLTPHPYSLTTAGKKFISINQAGKQSRKYLSYNPGASVS